MMNSKMWKTFINDFMMLPHNISQRWIVKMNTDNKQNYSFVELKASFIFLHKITMLFEDKVTSESIYNS